MIKRIIAIIFGVLAVALLNAIITQSRDRTMIKTGPGLPVQIGSHLIRSGIKNMPQAHPVYRHIYKQRANR